MSFTIKFYSDDGFRQIIRTAESFTILRGGNEAEITLHQKNPADDSRIDIKAPADLADPNVYPPRYAKAIIENEHGRTTEIIVLGSMPGPMPAPRYVLSVNRVVRNTPLDGARF